jgi:hypothetical protein
MFLLPYLAHTQIWLNLPIFILQLHKIDQKNIAGSCGAHCLVRSSWWSPRSSCTEVVIMSIPRVSSSYDVRRSCIFLYQVLGYEKRILVVAQKQKSIPICQNHLNNLVSFLVAHDVPRQTHLPCFDYPSRPPIYYCTAFFQETQFLIYFTSLLYTHSTSRIIMNPMYPGTSIYEIQLWGFFHEYQNYCFVPKVVIIHRKM